MSQDVAAAAITLQSKSYLIISLYNPPKQNPTRLLTGIEGNFSSNHLTSTILGGDLNCYSPLWGPSQSKHGEIFEGFALQNDLLCINHPDHDPTFVGHYYAPLTLTPHLSPPKLQTILRTGNFFQLISSRA